MNHISSASWLFTGRLGGGPLAGFGPMSTARSLFGLVEVAGAGLIAQRVADADERADRCAVGVVAHQREVEVVRQEPAADRRRRRMVVRLEEVVADPGDVVVVGGREPVRLQPGRGEDPRRQVELGRVRRVVGGRRERSGRA